MSALGSFVPGRSALHQLPTGAKLVGLLLVSAGVVALRTWWQPVLAVLVVVALYAVAGLRWSVLVAQLRPLLWIGLVVMVFHLVVSGWRPAVDVVASLVAVVLSAGLVTATTTTTAMIDTIVRALRPLRRLRVDPERVGLLLALSVRSVAVVAGLAQQVREAQRARGQGRSPRALGVPLLVRSLRHAQQLGEAMVARGVDD